MSSRDAHLPRAPGTWSEGRKAGTDRRMVIPTPSVAEAVTFMQSRQQRRKLGVAVSLCPDVTAVPGRPPIILHGHYGDAARRACLRHRAVPAACCLYPGSASSAGITERAAEQATARPPLPACPSRPPASTQQRLQARSAVPPASGR